MYEFESTDSAIIIRNKMFQVKFYGTFCSIINI